MWELWGTSETPEQSGSFDNWIKLEDCKMIKPSGLPLGVNSDEDLALLPIGHDFVIPDDKPEIRYLRIVMLETWTNSSFSYLAEFNLYGNIIQQ